MRKVLIVHFVLALLIVSSCKTKVPDVIPEIDIASNIFNMEKIYLSDYASSISYIPMEVDINNYIYEMSGIYADFSDEYIVDSDGVKCLLYDREGRFIRMIGGQGRGPGEYGGISLHGIFLRDERIYIHDYFTDDLIEYRIDGTFVQRYDSGLTVDEKYWMSDAYLINDSMIIGYYQNISGLEEYKAFLFDKNGSIIEHYQNYILFKLDPERSSAQPTGSSTYFRFENRIFFKENFNDTMFILNIDKQLEPCFVFNLGKYKLPVSGRGKSWEMADYIRLNSLYMNTKYLFMVVYYGKYFPASRITPETIELPSGNSYVSTQNYPKMLGVYDKEASNLVFSEPTDTDNPLYSSGFYNDIDAGPRFMPQKMVNDSTIAMKIQFYQLLEHIESNDFMNNIPKYPDQKRKLEMLVDSLKKIDFDNPVYMLVTFKDD